MDVLYLSISMGAGHLKAAEALNEYVSQWHPHSRSLIVDTFKYINPIVHKIFVDGYLTTIRLLPSVYGVLYKMSENMANMNRLSRLLSRLFSYKLVKLIDEFKPSIIVCTHPFPLQIVSYLKKIGRINLPTIGVLTDYVNHPFWLHDNVDAYVVAHESIKCDMLKFGIPREKIYSYGIPVSKAFFKKCTRHELLKQYPLEDKFTVLIMGGSLGFGDIKKVFLSFMKSYVDLQLIVVTGKNKRLLKQLTQYSRQYHKAVLLVGYTNDVSGLMDISDVIVTKPGGMTISEALVKHMPIFVMSAIPGQEERNSHFLITAGVAEKITVDISLDSDRLEQMKQNAKRLSMPSSGFEIVRLMEQLELKYL